MEVGHSQFTYFLGGGDKVNTVLRCGTTSGWLQGDAANTPCVAVGRSWQGRFPATEKVVAGRRTTVGKTTLAEMLNQAVMRMGGQHFSGVAGDELVIELAGILANVPVASKTGHPETIIAPAHGRVGKQWQRGLNLVD